MGPSEEEVQDMLEKAQRTQHIVTFGGAHLNTLNTKKDVTPIKSIEEAFVQNKTKIGKWNKFESKSADGEELERPMEIHLEVERKGPATAILGDQLFVFGGINTRARTMDTFEVCDLSGNCQTEIKDMFEHHVDEKEREKREREGGAWFTGKDVKIKGRGAYSGGPGPLFAASAVAQGGEIYVMGGCHDTDGKEQNENLWKMHPQMHGEGHEVKYKFEKMAPPPHKRIGATALAIGSAKILVLGGCDKHAKKIDVYDCDTNKWSTLPEATQLPTNDTTFGSAAYHAQTDTIYFYGGQLQPVREKKDKKTIYNHQGGTGKGYKLVNPLQDNSTWDIAPGQRDENNYRWGCNLVVAGDKLLLIGGGVGANSTNGEPEKIENTVESLLISTPAQGKPTADHTDWNAVSHLSGPRWFGGTIVRQLTQKPALQVN
jgi:N-acetylneuraminic acid mutarotase